MADAYEPCLKNGLQLLTDLMDSGNISKPIYLFNYILHETSSHHLSFIKECIVSCTLPLVTKKIRFDPTVTESAELL